MLAVQCEPSAQLGARYPGTTIDDSVFVGGLSINFTGLLIIIGVRFYARQSKVLVRGNIFCMNQSNVPGASPLFVF